MSPQEKMARRAAQPFPGNLRLAVTPQDKLDALELGRKIKAFAINELQAKGGDTHIKVLFAALQYVFYWLGALDAEVAKINSVELRLRQRAEEIGLNKLEAEMQKFQDEITTNGVLSIIQRCTESGFIETMPEPYSEAIEQIQEEEEARLKMEAAQESEANKTPEQIAAEQAIQDAMNNPSPEQPTPESQSQA